MHEQIAAVVTGVLVGTCALAVALALVFLQASWDDGPRPTPQGAVDALRATARLVASIALPPILLVPLSALALPKPLRRVHAATGFGVFVLSVAGFVGSAIVAAEISR